MLLREERGPGLGELHIGPALAHSKPSALDCELEAGAVFCRIALKLRQERPVDLFDVAVRGRAMDQLWPISPLQNDTLSVIASRPFQAR